MVSGGRANALPIIIAGLIVCGMPAYVLATLFGAGSVAMIAMMVSLFTFISIIGGSLTADMKVAAVLAPLIFVAATVPRIVSEWNAIAGAVVACAFMLVVVLLPLHDERLGNARMGAGMALPKRMLPLSSALPVPRRARRASRCGPLQESRCCASARCRFAMRCEPSLA